MHLQALYTYADKLQEVKADKEQVAMEMDVVCLNFSRYCGFLPLVIQDVNQNYKLAKLSV